MVGKQFAYTLTDQWGNRYIGKVLSTNASDAFNAAIKREQKKVRDLERIIMKAVIMPI